MKRKSILEKANVRFDCYWIEWMLASLVHASELQELSKGWIYILYPCLGKIYKILSGELVYRLRSPIMSSYLYVIGYWFLHPWNWCLYIPTWRANSTLQQYSQLTSHKINNFNLYHLPWSIQELFGPETFFFESSWDFPNGPVAKTLHSQQEPGSIPGQATRSHMPQTESWHVTTKGFTCFTKSSHATTKAPHATNKTWHSQINNNDEIKVNILKESSL